MIRQFSSAMACCLALGVSGCAVGASDAGSSESGGSHLAPTFGPDHAKHHARAHQPSAQAGSAGSPKPSTRPGTAAGAGTGNASPAGGPSSPTHATGTPTPAPVESASVTDGTGDASGVGTPSYVDLTGATVTRDGDRFRVRVDVAAPLPARQSDDRTMNVGCFVDTDGDGQVDYELWADLSDSGWGTSYRYPDGARYGGSSGVTVTVSGATLTLGFPASHVGGASSFRWATGAEYGTLEQVGSGTTAQDLAPDRGAVDFPS